MNFEPFSVTHTTPCSRKSKVKDAPVLITLSDSESEGEGGISCRDKIDLNCSVSSDEVEIMQPLADRIGLKRSHDLQSNRSNDLKSSSDLFKQHSVSKLLSPSNESLSIKNLSSLETNHTPLIGMCKEGTSMSTTPSQQAGMAALKRLEKKLSTPEHSASTSKSSVVSKITGRESISGIHKTTKITNEDWCGGNKEKEKDSVLSSAGVLKHPKKVNPQPTSMSETYSSTTVTKGLNSKIHTGPIIVDLTSSSGKGSIKSDSNVERSKVKGSNDMRKERDQLVGGGGVSGRNEEDVDMGNPGFLLRPGNFSLVCCMEASWFYPGWGEGENRFWAFKLVCYLFVNNCVCLFIR